MTTSTTNNDDIYYALVVDSGPIIRQSSLRNLAQNYYTVPAVLQEVRDSKARSHLEQLPFTLKTREASAEGIQAIVDFSRQTGDYHSLSAVDIQVLGLAYDLEREGCGGDLSHIRTTPKRTLGVGKIQSLGKEKEEEKVDGAKDEKVDEREIKSGQDFFVQPPVQESSTPKEEVQELPMQEKAAPTSWAKLVNPAASSIGESKIKEEATAPGFLNLSGPGLTKNNDDDDDISGQFSDAEEESDDDGYANSDKQVSDEECNVVILDPEEVEKRRAAAVEKELQLDFPSLSASMQVPCDEDEDVDGMNAAERAKEEAERRKQESLQPVTKSGKLYNSFRKYKDIMKPQAKKTAKTTEAITEEEDVASDAATPVKDEPVQQNKDTQSRIVGGMTMAGQGTKVDDDGEGWISSTTDIRKMKAAGLLNDPTRNPNDVNDNAVKLETGPPTSQRAACTTTDFAMQNVLLQMNLELLSVDGIKVRRLKSWVTRCGACYAVFSDGDAVGPVNTKRMFCAKCGSDFLQRIAASVDGKTGRLRLHLSKKHKNNLRGTKFSLPKPGTGNRFQGDLLLREDQLLMGAWNQKAKQRSGGRARSDAQSMFGSDLASTVGCHAASVKNDDIRVGFGRRNPNASKHGRERRGKKKKTSDKACGLRRY